MVHFDEHTLELYVTGAVRVQSQRTAIEQHLATCATCNGLAARMREYYADFQANLSDAGTGTAAAPGALARRDDRIGPAYRRDVHTIPVERFGPLAGAQRFVRRHPVAASAGSTIVLGMLGLLLYLSWPTPRGDGDPSYTRYDRAQGIVQIMDAKNKPLWDLRANADLHVYGHEDPEELKKYVRISDLDGDHRHEVISTLRADDEMYCSVLRVFDAEKGLRFEKRFSTEFAYLDRSYLPAIDIGSLLVDDVTASGRPEIWVTGNSRDRSPGVTIRMDATGAEVGRYWHFGQLREISCLALGRARTKQILLTGIDDADDTIHTVASVVVVLDPAKVTAVGRSTRNPGFHFPASEAEQYYVQLPVTDMNDVLQVLPAPPELRDTAATMIVIRSSTWPGKDPAGSFEFDFLFDRDMNIVDVKSNNHTDDVRRGLVNRGLLRGTIDRAYLQDLKSRVRYWDGTAWQPHPTPVIHHPAVASR